MFKNMFSHGVIARKVCFSSRRLIFFCEMQLIEKRLNTLTLLPINREIQLPSIEALDKFAGFIAQLLL